MANFPLEVFTEKQMFCHKLEAELKIIVWSVDFFQLLVQMISLLEYFNENTALISYT